MTKEKLEMPKFPKTLYVNEEKSDNTIYYVADTNTAGLVNTGEKIMVGVYELTGVKQVEGMVVIRDVTPKRKP